MKRLIVDAGVDWIDRKEIKLGDSIICRSPNDQPCVCIPIPATDCSPSRWEIWDCNTGERVATAMDFIDWFNDENSTGRPMRGWKFYKVD